MEPAVPPLGKDGTVAHHQLPPGSEVNVTFDQRGCLGSTPLEVKPLPSSTVDLGFRGASAQGKRSVLENALDPEGA
jgi:hypothetical protein